MIEKEKKKRNVQCAERKHEHNPKLFGGRQLQTPEDRRREESDAGVNDEIARVDNEIGRIEVAALPVYRLVPVECKRLTKKEDNQNLPDGPEKTNSHQDVASRAGFLVVGEQVDVEAENRQPDARHRRAPQDLDGNEELDSPSVGRSMEGGHTGAGGRTHLSKSSQLPWRADQLDSMLPETAALHADDEADSESCCKGLGNGSPPLAEGVGRL